MNHYAIVPYLRLLCDRRIVDHENAYLFGYLIGQQQLDESLNPFERVCEAEEWIEGWWAGFYNEMPTYPLTKYDQACLDAWQTYQLTSEPLKQAAYRMVPAEDIKITWLKHCC